MKTDAPNISGTYPLAGERIGPAWREVWAMLSRTAWVDGADLAYSLAPRYGLQPKTVKGLLNQARTAGLLDVRLRRNPGRKRATAQYRVKSQVNTSCH